jgi:hypothetical protein
MEVNWTIITYLVVGYFAMAGFSRGWWKEAITTVVLSLFIFLLQNPDWAEGVVEAINEVITAIWQALPDTIRPTLNEGINTIFAVNTAGSYQLSASDPETWLTILALVAGVAVLLGRVSFGNQPTPLGKVLGAVVGGFNGLIMLSLIREYLDGRALPGQVVSASSELRLIGGSSFGPPASGVSIQATGLPNFTILDSALPWIAIAIGVFFFLSILRTRFAIARSADGRKLVTRVPPFYRVPPPPPPPPTTPVRIVQ